MRNALRASRFHAGTWWLLGISLAICSGIAENSLTLLIIQSFAILVILGARESAPWSRSLRFYLTTALLVVAIRVAFRILFNFDADTNIALELPTIHLSFGPLGAVDLLGRVSYTALNSAVRDGLRMSAIILSIGLANSLANPRRLLKSTPSALNEVATAFAIAINLAPQLIASSKRVNQSQRLRNLGSKTGVTGLIVPIFEDALERSMALAASMDARGFGRLGNLSTGLRLTSRLASFVGAVGFAVGAYLLLTSDVTWATLLLFAIGIGGFATSLRIAGIASVKTRYVSQRWASRDWLLSIAALGLVALFVSGVIR